MLKEDKSDIVTKIIPQKALRWWPGIIIVSIQWFGRFIIPMVIPSDLAMQIGVFIGLLGGLAIIVWWLFFSRALLIDRLMAVFGMVFIMLVAHFLLHDSIATAMMGMMYIIYAVPVMSLAFVIWAIVSRRLTSNAVRRLTMALTILLASGFWIFLRTDGMDGDGRHDLAWRWAMTHEDQLLAKSSDEFVEMPTLPPSAKSEAEWPGFRGKNRDGIITGIRLETDWSKSPPIELWRRAIGPGCSSMAIHGDLLYTQEQLGEHELVCCYRLSDGNPIWKHQDKTRFYDSHAGAGPRSTPALAEGRVYTMGATGILNALDGLDGSLIWSRNAAIDANVEVLPWGFTSSPLVIQDVLIVALSGKLMAYDVLTGNPRWSGPDGGNSYSSPHLFMKDNTTQVLLMNKSGAISIDPSSGQIIWTYPLEVEDRILQPGLIDEQDILFSREYKGVYRLSVSNGSNGWRVQEVWNSTEFKPSFHDFVVHKGYAYGFDGPSMSCMDLKDGKRMWKGERYRGWLLLLSDQDLILVLSEKGDLALVPADPEQFKELSRYPAINGKTWNHPAMVGNILLVRNAREMAAFRLPLLTDNKISYRP